MTKRHKISHEVSHEVSHKVSSCTRIILESEVFSVRSAYLTMLEIEEALNENEIPLEDIFIDNKLAQTICEKISRDQLLSYVQFHGSLLQDELTELIKVASGKIFR